MSSAAFFRNTPLAVCLRFLSGDRLFPHPALNAEASASTTSSYTSSPWNAEEKEGEAESQSQNNESQEVKTKAPTSRLVTWDGEDDPNNPQNLAGWGKALIGFQIGILTFIVTVTSSIFSGGIPGFMETFGCDNAVAALGLSLFVAGYGLGPAIWGPLSEIPFVGRNLVYLPTLIIFVCLQVPTALAGNLGTFFSMRLLAGIIGSPVLAVGGGSVIDVFSQQQLPYILGIWGSMAALGPLLGPLFGGFCYQEHNWRWTIWAVLWMSGFVLVLTFCCLPETSADKLLRDKAARLRKQTGDPNWRSESELKPLMSLREIGRVYLIRPFALLAFEPIVLLLSLYLALLYGLEYLFFEAFPFVFAGIYGWGPGVTGLGFFGVFFGVILGLIFQMWFIRFRYGGMWAKLGHPPPLEAWLWTMLFGSVCVPVSMFWFGWAAQAKMHWIVPLIGSVPFGFALFIFFQGIMTYLAMGYSKHAASVLAANDFLRCAFAAAFPIFTHAMFNNLGVGWASSVPGFISTVLIPIPFIFYRYGAKIRSWSKYAD